MTRDEAISAYRLIHKEIDQYLVDVRPKLKSYDAHMVHESIRVCVVDNYTKTPDAKALREIAMKKFRTYAFKYLKGKGPKNELETGSDRGQQRPVVRQRTAVRNQGRSRG